MYGIPLGNLAPPIFSEKKVNTQSQDLSSQHFLRKYTMSCSDAGRQPSSLIRTQDTKVATFIPPNYTKENTIQPAYRVPDSETGLLGPPGLNLEDERN